MNIHALEAFLKFLVQTLCPERRSNFYVYQNQTLGSAGVGESSLTGNEFIYRAVSMKF